MKSCVIEENKDNAIKKVVQSLLCMNLNLCLSHFPCGIIYPPCEPNVVIILHLIESTRL